MPKFAASLLIGSALTFAALSFVPVAVFDVESDKVVEATVRDTGVAAVATDTKTSVADVKPPIDTRSVVKHVPLPEQVKAIYMTSCVVGTPSFRQKLVDLVADTEVNSLIIDIKDFSGTISFLPESEEWLPAWQNSRCGARDMRDFISALHGINVFVIGRITVFQDPFYTAGHPDLAVKRADGVTVWKDYKGLSFIDVGAIGGRFIQYWL